MKEEASLGGTFGDFNARFYDPLIGRFLSADTIVPRPSNPQSLNRFAFVRNNPLKYVDPSGHDPTHNQCDYVAIGCGSIGSLRDIDTRHKIEAHTQWYYDEKCAHSAACQKSHAVNTLVGLGLFTTASMGACLLSGPIGSACARALGSFLAGAGTNAVMQFAVRYVASDRDWVWSINTTDWAEVARAGGFSVIGGVVLGKVMVGFDLPGATSRFERIFSRLNGAAIASAAGMIANCLTTGCQSSAASRQTEYINSIPGNYIGSDGDGFLRDLAANGVSNATLVLLNTEMRALTVSHDEYVKHLGE
jgi:RHS repeat-associated protein